MAGQWNVEIIVAFGHPELWDVSRGRNRARETLYYHEVQSTTTKYTVADPKDFTHSGPGGGGVHTIG